MGFASPTAGSRSILLAQHTATAAGTTNYDFVIPQDTNGIIAKFWTEAGFVPITTGAVQVTIQTSEDGGTTWRDCAAWTTQAAINNNQAHFAPIAVAWGTGRGVANWIGSVGAASLALAATASVALGVANGLPMMGTLGRARVTVTSTLDTGGVNVQVFAPSTGHDA